MQKPDADRHPGNQWVRGSLVDLSIILIIIIGLLIRLHYISASPANVRTHDYRGHISYVQFMASTAMLPQPDSCFECWQPPLYYACAAVVFRTSLELGLNPFFLLQLFSLACMAGFIIAGTLVIRLFFSDPLLVVLGTLVLSLWPSGIVHAGRIGNEPMLYFLYGLGLLFICRWWVLGERRDFLVASVFAFLATICKATGLLVFAVLIACTYWPFGALPGRQPTKKIDQVVVAFLLVAACSITFLHPPFGPGGDDWLIGNSSQLVPEIMVGNKPVNFVRFNPVHFVTEPFVDSGDGASRHNVIHYLLKTSMFGAFAFTSESEGIAKVMSFMLLMILLYLLLSVIGRQRLSMTRFLPIYLSLAALVAAFFFVRYRLPTSANSDFRFIVPATISLTVLYVTAIGGHFAANRGAYAWIGVALMSAFLGLSSFFWLLAA
jgi:hypothetical protein